MSLFQRKVGFVTQPRKADSFLEKQLTCALTCYTSTEAASKGMGQPFKSYELILVSCYVLFFSTCHRSHAPVPSFVKIQSYGILIPPCLQHRTVGRTKLHVPSSLRVLPPSHKKSCLQRSWEVFLPMIPIRIRTKILATFSARRSIKTYTFHYWWDGIAHGNFMESTKQKSAFDSTVGGSSIIHFVHPTVVMSRILCLAPCFTICHLVVWFSFVITWSVDLRFPM